MKLRAGETWLLKLLLGPGEWDMIQLRSFISEPSIEPRGSLHDQQYLRVTLPPRRSSLSSSLSSSFHLGCFLSDTITFPSARHAARRSLQGSSMLVSANDTTFGPQSTIYVPHGKPPRASAIGPN